MRVKGIGPHANPAKGPHISRFYINSLIFKDCYGRLKSFSELKLHEENKNFGGLRYGYD